MTECGLCGARVTGLSPLTDHRCPDEVEALRRLLREVVDCGGQMSPELLERIREAGRWAETKARTPRKAGP